MNDDGETRDASPFYLQSMTRLFYAYFQLVGVLKRRITDIHWREFWTFFDSQRDNEEDAVSACF